MEGSSWCYNHDPGLAEERSTNARKAGKAGGRGRPSPLSETTEAKRILKDLIRKVQAGEVERSVATAAFMGLNVLARYVELEYKLVDLEALAERIGRLEQDQREGGRSWAT